MSRPIKFRYVYQNKEDKNCVTFYYTLEDLENDVDGVILDGYEIIHKDQFTGMKDKNKKEIYERDKLRGVSNNIFSKGEINIYEVFWGIDHWHIKDTYFSLQELFNYCNNNVEVSQWSYL